MTMTLKDEFTSVEDDERYKAIADKFLEKYDKILSHVSDSRRRWVWELIQNAKDSRNECGLVVDISLKEDGLRFRHNGDPFTPKQLSGLFKQVSDKKSDNSVEGITGKYGTGFISTYLLSRIIHVDGVLRPTKGSTRRFRIELNRNANTSEELMPIIREGWNSILGDALDDTKFIPFNNYDRDRKEEDLDTGFFYPLSGDAILEVEEDLKKLSETAPYALIFNRRIRRIAYRINSSELTCSFEIANQLPTDPKKLVRVTETRNTETHERVFLIEEQKDFTLAVEILQTHPYLLKSPSRHSPTLYRDFPLIGSEAFRFPFVLNSSRLHPEEQRDSIFLNSKQAKGLSNRAFIKLAMQGAVSMIEWLASEKAKNMYVATQLQSAEVHWEPEVAAWFQEEILQPFRGTLLALPIVETSAGFMPLKDVWIPDPTVVEGTESKDELWELGVSYYGSESFPLRDDWRAWHQHMDIESTAGKWNDVLMMLTIPNLLERIAKDGADNGLLSLTVMSGNDEPSESESLSWLNRVLELSIRAGYRDEIDHHAIIPNMLGKLRPLKELFAEEEGKSIPDPLLEVLELLGKPWKSEIIHRDSVTIDPSHKCHTITEASELAGKILSEKQQKGTESVYTFFDRENALDICITLLQFVGRDTDRTELQNYLRETSLEIFQRPNAESHLVSLEEFDAEPAIHNILRLIAMQLEVHIKNIQGLAAIIEKDEASSLRWLNEFLRRVQKAELGHLVTYRKTVPNRQGTFCRLGELYDNGTLEQPLNENLLDILRLLNPKEDWHPKLIAEEIGISCGRALTLAELTRKVQDELSFAISNSTNIEDIREGLLAVTSWYNRNSKEANKLIPGINSQVNQVFFLLALQDERKSENVLSILRRPEKFASLARIAESESSIESIEQLFDVMSKEGLEALTEFLNNSEKGDQLLRLLSQANATEILTAITSDSLSPQSLQQMLTMFPNGLPSWVIEQAAEHAETETDFWYKLQIGEEMEKSLLPILQKSIPHLKFDHLGRGPFDFSITKEGTLFHYKLELKSVKAGNADSVKLTKNQGREAVESGRGYGLVVIERLPGNAKPSDDYIKKNIMFMKAPGDFLRNRVESFNEIESVVNRDEDVQLSLGLSDPKFGIRYKFVKDNCANFETMIETIIQYFN